MGRLGRSRVPDSVFLQGHRQEGGDSCSMQPAGQSHQGRLSPPGDEAVSERPSRGAAGLRQGACEGSKCEIWGFRGSSGPQD